MSTHTQINTDSSISIDDLSDASKALWCPELQDERLRTEIFANDRVQERLLTQLLGHHDLSRADFALDNICPIIELLKTSKLDFLYEILGLAGVANTLAAHSINGTLQQNFPDIALDRIAWALKFRRKTDDGQHDDTDYQSCGKNLLSAFLSGLKDSTAKVVCFQLGLSPSNIRTGHRGSNSDEAFARKVLNDWCGGR